MINAFSKIYPNPQVEGKAEIPVLKLSDPSNPINPLNLKMGKISKIVLLVERHNSKIIKTIL